jgi:hypothetical protein
MNNQLLQVKIKQRLNKIASNDYDNIESWQIVEAFNKVQVEWIRDQLGGNNIRRESDEQSKRRIDDLQILLKSVSLSGTNKTLFYESLSLPEDYCCYKRVSGRGMHKDCEGDRKFRIDLAEEGNAEDYLRDLDTCPSWEWAETFCTLLGNKIKIYTNDQFKITQAELTYYRFPQNILFEGVTNPFTGTMSAADVSCEFKTDIAELLIDLTAAQLAGDIESFNQYTRNKQNADAHN